MLKKSQIHEYSDPRKNVLAIEVDKITNFVSGNMLAN